MTRYQAIAFRVAWLARARSGRCGGCRAGSVREGLLRVAPVPPGAPFRPWILRIVANEARNRARSSRRRDGLALRVAAADPGARPRPPRPLPSVEPTLRRSSPRWTGSRERDRLVVAYRYLFEMSEAETAEALDLRPGTVKSRLSRALVRLRTELGTGPRARRWTEHDRSVRRHDRRRARGPLGSIGRDLTGRPTPDVAPPSARRSAPSRRLPHSRHRGSGCRAVAARSW